MTLIKMLIQLDKLFSNKIFKTSHNSNFSNAFSKLLYTLDIIRGLQCHGLYSYNCMALEAVRSTRSTRLLLVLFILKPMLI